jgi:hypothetical protein
MTYVKICNRLVFVMKMQCDICEVRTLFIVYSDDVFALRV